MVTSELERASAALSADFNAVLESAQLTLRQLWAEDVSKGDLLVQLRMGQVSTEVASAYLDVLALSPRVRVTKEGRISLDGMGVSLFPWEWEHVFRLREQVEAKVLELLEQCNED